MMLKKKTRLEKKLNKGYEMTEPELKQLFIAECVSKRDLMCLSHPLNTKLSAQFEVFLKCYSLWGKA